MLRPYDWLLIIVDKTRLCEKIGESWRDCKGNGGGNRASTAILNLRAFMA